MSDSFSDLQNIQLTEEEIEGELYYCISNVHKIRPFFMSIVSDTNHWMFISSNGGITAGRQNADSALFPYYTDDKITESAEHTGCKTLIRVTKDNNIKVWEPFSIRSEGLYSIERHILKSKNGNSIIFKEINHDLHLSFEYTWQNSNQFGFVRKSTIKNMSASEATISILDGLQNLLPYGVGSDLQNNISNLVDAYKVSELVKENGLGIFSLSAIIIDRAEPSEALKASIVWSYGIDNPIYLLSQLQLEKFRKSGLVHNEEEIKGEKNCYFIVQDIMLKGNTESEWFIIADISQNHSAIEQLQYQISNNSELIQEVKKDIALGTKKLNALLHSADSLQITSDTLKDTRHYTNVLFNCMRGGIFDNNYQIDIHDYCTYLQTVNKHVYLQIKAILQEIPAKISLFELIELIEQTHHKDAIRLTIEYLPLTFSRRHGDPSRPWNRFSINTLNADGTKRLDYQGNWRDIFQNWEALVHSYPKFIMGMIHKFLNASTFDGYNPYRISKDGFDWETIEPENPWSYIGYWGDHQIIYLLKLLEFAEKSQPGWISQTLHSTSYVYANIPYKIKSYVDIVKNPKNTIEFDNQEHKSILDYMGRIGSDGALLLNQHGEICRISFCEKILATLLSRLSNFIIDGGIWMNTQRPEWNDANNALVGNGVSMVTLCYLKRFLDFIKPIIQSDESSSFSISIELADCFSQIHEILLQHSSVLQNTIDNKKRKLITDQLGMAGSRFRNNIYDNKFSGNVIDISKKEIISLMNISIDYVDHSILANKRSDGLYHSYNLLTISEDEMGLSHLSEMLEGQVAVLSSGVLSHEQALDVLDALLSSKMYRKDQQSYMLYPYKVLPKFLEKNCIPKHLINSSKLLLALIQDGDISIIEKDIHNVFHFNGNFRNAEDILAALHSLENRYKELNQQEEALILSIFESVFNHKEFTGRSGTFYGYEGIGSIYWHMVSKLQYAVQEICYSAILDQAHSEIIHRLIQHYYLINEGIGIHKSPALYGAFPTDPYSHTPFGKGAQQPGMTGQVKEDILCRMGELGIIFKNGRIHFQPKLLQKKEFLQDPIHVEFYTIFKTIQKLHLPSQSLMFSICQIPVIYTVDSSSYINIYKQDGSVYQYDGLSLSDTDTKSVFERNGSIEKIHVFVEESMLWKG